MVTNTEENVGAILDESEKIMNSTKDKVENSVHTGKVMIEKENERFKSAVKAGIKAYKTEKDR